MSARSVRASTRRQTNDSKTNGSFQDVLKNVKPLVFCDVCKQSYSKITDSHKQKCNRLNNTNNNNNNNNNTTTTTTNNNNNINNNNNENNNNDKNNSNMDLKHSTTHTHTS